MPRRTTTELGADGGYGDGCSALGGASSSKAVSSKRNRSVPQTTEEFAWALEDVTKIVVAEASGAYEDLSVAERTMLTFTCSIKTGGTWVRQLPKEIGLMQVMQDDTARDLYWCAVLKFLRELFLTTPSEEAMGELLGFPNGRWVSFTRNLEAPALRVADRRSGEEAA
jgi:hypothetical protein